MDSEVRNIFVIGLDPFNLKLLRNVRNADSYAFHELLDYDEIAGTSRFDMEALLDKARGILRAFPDEIHAIVGYWDFPGVLMMPILRAEFGLRGPSLESVLMCEHKYLSRVEQKRVVPDQERWSRKFGPVVKVDRMTRETIRNDEEKDAYA